MMTYNRERWTLLGAIGGTLLLAACGGTKDLGGDRPSSGAGTSGSASGTSLGGASGAAGALMASSGGAGGSAGVTGGMTGELGDGGQGIAGKPGTVANGYDFYVLPGLAPLPLDTLNLHQGTGWSSYSTNLELLAGNAWWYRGYAPDSSLESGDVPYVWTRAGGVQAVPEAVPHSLRVAADGSAVFGLRSNAPGAISLLRWTPSDGVELFEIEDAGELTSPAGSNIYAVSANGKAVVVTGVGETGDDTPRLWRLGHDQNRAMKVNARPTHFSGDGSMLFLTFEEAHDKLHVYRASVEGEPFTLEELKQPPGYTDCSMINPSWEPGPASDWRFSSKLSSADGSLAVGTCGWSTPSPSMFRWEAGDEAMTIVPEGPAFPMLMSPDGSKILGTSHYDSSADSKLVWWTPETSLVVPTAGKPIGLRPDGVSAWVVLGEHLTYRGPRLWSRSEGLLPLTVPSAALEVNANLVTLSADGALALGLVGIEVPGESLSPNHSLLWDGAVGMRDIAEELSAAGLDLSKYDTGLQGFALHVDDDAIVIFGWTSSDDGGTQTWLAKIPAR